MSWITPYETWSDSDTPTPSDFNRIEGNTDYLKDAVDATDSDILSNASSISSVEARVSTLEGTGSAQGVGTGDSPTFAGGTFTGTITDKNGREVLALETEYQTTTTAAGTGMKSGTFTFSGTVKGVASINCAATNAVAGSNDAVTVAYTISGSSVSWNFYESLSLPTRRVSCTAFI